jgi:hypothetical protein
MFKFLYNKIKSFKIALGLFWQKHIISYVPPELEDDEFSDKFR